ncbi:uncharacterized protein ACN2A1_006829 isoform 2-T4 [Glossina fuscipes fuscipes]
MDGEKFSDAKQLILAENSDEMLPANSLIAVNSRSVLKELNVNDGHQNTMPAFPVIVFIGLHLHDEPANMHLAFTCLLFR